MVKITEYTQKINVVFFFQALLTDIVRLGMSTAASGGHNSSSH